MVAGYIVPWTCHICGKITGEDADLFPGGRLCDRCTKMTCRSHIKRVKVAAQAGEKAKAEYVCKKCAP